MFGLADTPESLLQEGGRPKRGLTEANNFRGFAFFFHRGTLGMSPVTLLASLARF